MHDLMKTVIECGLDMGGTDRAWYEAHGTGQRRGIGSDTIIAAKGMRALGLTWPEVGEKLGYNHEALRRRCR